MFIIFNVNVEKRSVMFKHFLPVGLDDVCYFWQCVHICYCYNIMLFFELMFWSLPRRNLDGMLKIFYNQPQFFGVSDKRIQFFNIFLIKHYSPYRMKLNQAKNSTFWR